MSNKMPMVSTDKVEVKLTVKVEAVVAIDSIGKMAGLSRAAVVNGYIEDCLRRSGYVLTKEDDQRVEDIKAENRAKRDALKAKKGVK